MIKATIHEAKTHLSKLIAEVESGKEVVLWSKPVHYSDDCFTPLTNEELREWGV
jgi:hypothetical protein